MHDLKDPYKVIARRRHTPIYITENGVAEKESAIASAISDTQRCAFFKDYLQAGLQAHKNGVDLRGYFVWCLLDTFEWRGNSRCNLSLSASIRKLDNAPQKQVSPFIAISSKCTQYTPINCQMDTNS